MSRKKKKRKNEAVGSEPPRRGLRVLSLLVGAGIIACGTAFALSGSSSSDRLAARSLDALSAAKVALVDCEFVRAEEILRSLGDEEEARLLLGRVLLERGRLLEAKEILTALLKEDPKSFPATMGLGRVYRGLGQLDLALVYFRRGTELRSDDARAWRELGLAQKEKGDHLAALSSIQRSLSLDKAQEDLSSLMTQLAVGNSRRSP